VFFSQKSLSLGKYHLYYTAKFYLKTRYCHFVFFSGDPTNVERTTALAIALSKIFWRSGENKAAVVVL
jgi:hypothetical protein